MYTPCVSQKDASRSALKRMLAIFFGGSPDHAIAALLEASAEKLTDA
jgi:hypothetical protein